MLLQKHLQFTILNNKASKSAKSFFNAAYEFAKLPAINLLMFINGLS